MPDSRMQRRFSAAEELEEYLNAPKLVDGAFVSPDLKEPKFPSPQRLARKHARHKKAKMEYNKTRDCPSSLIRAVEKFYAK